MSLDDNRAISASFMREVLNKHDLSKLNQFMREDIFDHDQFPGLPQGIEGQKQLFSILFKAFPDQQYTTDEVIAEGDRVVIRSTMRATHTGDFMGIPATGKTVAVKGIDIVRIANGKMAEHWGLFDAAGLMMQVGAMPPPGKPK